MNTETAPQTITFETATCDRCMGTGSMPYSAYNGVCFKCNGNRKVVTRAGIAARKAFQTARAGLCIRKLAEAVEVGDRVSFDNGGRFSAVTEIRETSCALRAAVAGETATHGAYTRDETMIDLVTRRATCPTKRTAEVLVLTAEIQAAAIAKVAKRKGVAGIA